MEPSTLQITPSQQSCIDQRYGLENSDQTGEFDIDDDRDSISLSKESDSSPLPIVEDMQLPSPLSSTSSLSQPEIDYGAIFHAYPLVNIVVVGPFRQKAALDS